MPEIAKQLGVAHILEGSVQKSGDSVRVNVQLIRAADDSHLWGDIFDRKLTDIFSVESNVAKAIADRLRAKLTGQEEEVITSKPTNNPAAYDAYLRGLAYTLKTGGATPAKSLGAQKYLREAVRLDPQVCVGLGAVIKRRRDRLHHAEPSTNNCASGRNTTGSRNRAHSSTQSRRSVDGQGLLLLRLFKGL